MLKNVRYYHKRKVGMDNVIGLLEKYRKSLSSTKDVPELMGLEGYL